MACFRYRAIAALSALTGFFIVGTASPCAAAQTVPAAGPPPAPIIVMVDMQQVVYTSKAGKGIQAQIESERQAFSKDVAKQEDELHKSQAEFDRQRSLLAPEALEAKNRELQQRLGELDRQVKVRQQALQQSFSEAMSKVEDEALRIVAEIAAERGANLVVQKAAVIFGKDGFDITSDALGRLDQRLASVTVNAPKIDGVAPGKPAEAPPAKKK